MQSSSKACFTKNLIIKIFTLFLLCVYLVSGISHPLHATTGSSTLKINGQSIDVNIKNYSKTNSSGMYVFRSAITYEIENPVDTQFNRFTIKYTSTNCLKGTLYYNIGTRSYNEDFYIESGNSKSFSSLIDGYLKNKKATKISKIVFTGIESKENAFILHEISTTAYKVESQDTIYIENSRFKLGVHLIWGGGLSYFEDKKDSDNSLKNLLNYHDTGRLVQQSYYGTSELPYECATYSGSVWSYNPVQGGDQYGNKSKLVDFYISQDSIYVKCRPLDWAQNNKYTFSYMENSYTVHDDYIAVDNRFIDFSGYNHGGIKDQELPAFYTISYLDKFTFYNGAKPWTDDKLTHKYNLPFWGGNANAYFPVNYGNTETWCAWTNSKTDYGIGLYTPEVTTLLAGRHGYNGSKDPLNGATNYVAPLIRMTMQNFVAFEYSYLITTGTTSQIRSTFKQQKDNIDQNWTFDGKTDDSIDYTRLDFDSTNEVSVFTKLKDCYVKNSTSGAVKFTVSVNKDSCDAYAYINYGLHESDLNTADYRYLVYSYMLQASNSDFGVPPQSELFICTGDRTSAEAGASIVVDLIQDGMYHCEIIDLYQYSWLWPSSGAKINKIRLDFLSNSSLGDVFYLSEFSLAKDKKNAEQYAQNSTATAKPTSTAGTPELNSTTSIITNPPTMPPDDDFIQNYTPNQSGNNSNNGGSGSNNGQTNDNNNIENGNQGDNNQDDSSSGNQNNDYNHNNGYKDDYSDNYSSNNHYKELPENVTQLLVALKILGISTGALFTIGGIVTLIWFLVWKKKNKKKVATDASVDTK